MVFPDTVASSLREFQAANRHGNGRRENLIAIFIPSGSMGAIELKTAVVRGCPPVLQHVEEETRHGFLPAGANEPVGWSFVRWSKQPCQKLRLLNWQPFLVAPLGPKPEGAILVEPDVPQARRISPPNLAQNIAGTRRVMSHAVPSALGTLLKGPAELVL
jgi:hypothetical protein